jgi:hypothetical protein
VYDNYSKLLSATSTIRRMRGNMDPLAPATHTLGPAISHIAETAALLSSSVHGQQAKAEGLGISVRVEQDIVEREATTQQLRQKQTVRWVLDTPRRLRELLRHEQDDEAEREWEDMSRLLDQWKGVAGVEELRRECENIMKEEDDSD